MATNLLVSGGPGHDFDATSAALAQLLEDAGIRSTVFDDPHEAFAALSARPEAWDLVTVNALRWAMRNERHAALADRWAFPLRPGEVETVERHVRDGGALLACHAAVICFDAEPRWAACTGATWNWDRSSHPPRGPAMVSVTEVGRAHPITTGIDDFSTVDEIYGFLDQQPDLEPLLTSEHGGAHHPVLWARTVGRGRVVTDLLGHDLRALTNPVHAEILRRAARWLVADGTAPPAHLNGSDATP